MWIVYEKRIRRYPVAEFDTEEEAASYQNKMRWKAYESLNDKVTLEREEIDEGAESGEGESRLLHKGNYDQDKG